MIVRLLMIFRRCITNYVDEIGCMSLRMVEKPSKNHLFLISFYIFTFFCFLPFIRYLPVTTFQMPILMICYILLSISVINQKGIEVFLRFIALSLFIIIFNFIFIYLQNYFNSAIPIVNQIGGNYSLFVAAFPILFVYSRGFDYVEKERFFNLICFLVFITSVTTIIGTYTYSSPSRELATPYNIDLDTLYKSRNIGGYGFVYFLVLFYPVVLKKLFDHFSIPRLIFLGVCAFCVIRSEYLIAIMLLAISIILTMAIYRKKYVVWIIAVILILFIFFNLETILVWAINKFSASYTVSSRLLMLLNYYKDSSITGNLLGREEVYRVSIDSFLSNPFFGGLFGKTQYHVGGHSAILDYLGHSGVFGVAILIPFLRFCRKNTSLASVRIHQEIIVLYILAFILASINTFSTQELFYAILIIPVLLT